MPSPAFASYHPLTKAASYHSGKHQALLSFADIPGNALEAPIVRVLHHSRQRVRFATDGVSEKILQLQAQLLHSPGVLRVRINKMAACCVVEFARDFTLPTNLEAGLSDWLFSLPSITTCNKAEQQPVAYSPEEGEGEDEERFVPTRIILPLTALGLTFLAGPLALPPLGVAAFILIASHLTFKRAWQGLRAEQKINVDFLDALAVTLHSLEGFLLGPAVMISMIEGGEAIRDATQRIASSANVDLLATLQTDVRVIVDGNEVIRPSTSLMPGDRIRLSPGDQIPIDGVIESGDGSLDVVKLTGESVPRHAGPGDEVLAGFILLEGTLTIETKAVGESTRVGQITSMIQAAPVFDTRVGNYAGKIANRFVLPTLALAGLSLLISGGSIAQAASLLMFDLGSGLRVSVPTAIMAALSKAGSQGLLIRSGRSLEILVDIDVIVFDKTGTLTEGHPMVTHLAILDNSNSEKILKLAASSEHGLRHPIAEAIVSYAEKQGITPVPCDSWDYRLGRGVCATIDGHYILIGNARLLRDEGIEPVEASEDPQLAIATPIYMVVDGDLAAIFYAADTIRSDSRHLIAELHRRGIQTHMLTGDIAPVAHAIAESLGLKPEEVHAEALPDEKAEFVKGLSAKGHRVAFVGDGINDSAALAYADVSISFASGSDLARETADIVLINDKVSDLLVAQDIAKRTFSIVRENIGIVGVPNLSALVLGTFLPISPIAAVMINNGSAIVAAANALKVLGFNQKKLPDSPSVSQSLTHQSTKEHQTSGASVGDSKTAVASEPADSNNINLLQLSSRLRLKHQSITARRNRPDFSEWSAQHDPDGLAWTYRSKTKSYGRS